MNDITFDPFEEYLVHVEASKKEKAYAWSTAIGLQDVDGLKTSSYLHQIAIKNIEGQITIDDAEKIINSYYETKPATQSNRTEEADKVSARITRLLSEPAFSFTPNEYISIHKELFKDIYDHAGTIRTYNITKKEWVLDGNTVLYGTASELKATLEYDIEQEKKFVYKELSTSQIIEHLAHFIANLWQIHIFEEGNTRTTAVFFIKYLRSLGYKADNDLFSNYSWYFRNALVRANFTDISKGVYPTTEFLEIFIRNLVLGENNKLSNRLLHINAGLKKSSLQDIETTKQDIETTKQDIETTKQDIETTKQDIEINILEFLRDKNLSNKTKNNIVKLYKTFDGAIFGRSDIVETLNITPSPASTLLQKMLSLGLILQVKGYGKGKYKFIDL